MQTFLVTNFWLLLIVSLLLIVGWVGYMILGSLRKPAALRPRSSLLDDPTTAGAYNFDLISKGTHESARRGFAWWRLIPLALLLLFVCFLLGRRASPVVIPPPRHDSPIVEEPKTGSVLNKKLDNPRASGDADRANKIGRMLGLRGRYDDLSAIWPQFYARDKQLINSTDAVPADLQTYDLILLGCPGEVSSQWQDALREYVNQGGYVISSCWSLPHFIEQTFPGYIQRADEFSGASKQVSAIVPNANSPFTRGAKEQGLKTWTIGDSNYFINILRPEVVQKLLTSPEIGTNDALVVAFPYGRGWVLFTTSEVKLQGKSGSSEFNAAAYLVTNALDAAVKQHHTPKG